MLNVVIIKGLVRDFSAPKRDLNVGETVKIKPLKLVKSLRKQGDFPYGFTYEMFKYCGKKAKIVKVEDFLYMGKAKQCFELDIDDQEFSWSKEMFDWDALKEKIMMKNE